MKVFLVEDEWVHAEDIRISIENLGFEWLGYSSEGFDAINKINELQPDIILLDMMLHGALSGIAIASHINKEIKKPFIFITSVIDDAVIEQGLHTNPVAYLTKPVNDGDLKAALIKVKTFYTAAANDLYDVNDTPDQLLIRIGKNLKPLIKSHITFIETAEKNYCKIHAAEKESYTVKKSLAALLTLLNPKYFYRVHKEYIINLQAVTKVDEQEHLVYVGITAIPIGNNYKHGFLENFNVL
jgi:DNA-binding LytR/AlgR family response regulator